MSEQEFRKLEVGDIVLSPLDQKELPIIRVERKKAHMLGSALVTKRVHLQGGASFDARTCWKWKRKGAVE
ncbi:MAG: ERCC4 domain-containing protein [Chthonomonas sp.]|nr:ERCC4 domain-containing protein [Chthonomonas sp.]